MVAPRNAPPLSPLRSCAPQGLGSLSASLCPQSSTRMIRVQQGHAGVCTCARCTSGCFVLAAHDSQLHPQPPPDASLLRASIPARFCFAAGAPDALECWLAHCSSNRAVPGHHGADGRRPRGPTHMGRTQPGMAGREAPAGVSSCFPSCPLSRSSREVLVHDERQAAPDSLLCAK